MTFTKSNPATIYKLRMGFIVAPLYGYKPHENDVFSFIYGKARAEMNRINATL